MLIKSKYKNLISIFTFQKVKKYIYIYICMYVCMCVCVCVCVYLTKNYNIKLAKIQN